MAWKRLKEHTENKKQAQPTCVPFKRRLETWASKKQKK